MNVTEENVDRIVESINRSLDHLSGETIHLFFDEPTTNAVKLYHALKSHENGGIKWIASTWINQAGHIVYGRYTLSTTLRFLRSQGPFMDFAIPILNDGVFTQIARIDEDTTETVSEETMKRFGVPDEFMVKILTTRPQLKSTRSSLSLRSTKPPSRSSCGKLLMDTVLIVVCICGMHIVMKILGADGPRTGPLYR